MPGLDAIVVVDGIQAAHTAQLRLGRLHIAGLVDGARLQQHLLAVPHRVEIEAREGAVPARRRETGGLPVHAAVARHVHAGNAPMAGPGEPGNHQRAGTMGGRRLRARLGDDRFRVHDPGPFPRGTVLQRVGVFRCFLAAFHRRIEHLDAAQPLDPHIAFPAGNDEAHRIAMLLAQRLAIRLEGDEHVVERLFQRERAPVGGGVGALDIDPLAGRIARRAEARFLQQRAQRHTGIFHIVDHAMGELRAVELRAGPFHAGIRRALAEIDPVDARKPLQIGISKHKRRIDQAVYHQPVVLLAEVDGTGMMAFEGASLRRDGAVKRMDGREIDRRHGIGRQPLDIAPNHILLMVDRQAVGHRIDPVAECRCPVLHLGNQRIGRGAGAGGRSGRDGRARSEAAFQQAAACGP